MVRRWLTGFAVVLVAGAVVELVLLGFVIWWIGAAWTVGLLIVKTVVGYLLARRTGRRGWRQFRAALDSGRPPGRDGTDAAVGFAAAMLVLLAGFIGAVAGLVLMIPPVRRRVAALAERVVERQLTAATANGMFGPRPVRVKREQPREHMREQPPEQQADRPPAPRAGDDGGVIEGEILPPR